jgi:hypothetical protein
MEGSTAKEIEDGDGAIDPMLSPLQSPVPLNREEEASAEVRALAEALAPSLMAAEEILQVPAEFRLKPKREDYEDESATFDDDHLDDEVEALRSSEAILRQELDLAQDFSSLFNFGAVAESYETEKVVKEDVPGSSHLIESLFSPAVPKHSATSEADVDDNDQKVDERLEPIQIPDTPHSVATNRTSFSPDRDNDSLISLTRTSPRSSGRPLIPYTVNDHRRALSLIKEEYGGWYSVGLGRHFGLPQQYADEVKEYCLAIPNGKLRQLFIGLPERLTDSTKAVSTPKSRSSNATPSPPLPVRTIEIRIRPDVLCGAVMEAVHHAFTELHVRVTKRQGGNVQGVVVPLSPKEYLHREELVEDPPFLVDVRLVTSKRESYDRVLLIRVYHYRGDVPLDECGSSNMISPENTLNPSLDENNLVVEPWNNQVALHLREAAALVQIMESPTSIKKIVLPTGREENWTEKDIASVVSNHLVEHYRACPSVNEAGITLPSLNAEDFAVLQASGKLIQMIWEELETRDLAYITLLSSRFGSFPALPTLDVHYCSQLRRISREAMTIQLIKSASELEQYAREAELACANMIALLKPTFDLYGIDSPRLPKPKPLTEYPLDFIAPQVECPPWGVKVQHALNEIQAWTGDAHQDGDPSSLQFTSAQPIHLQKSLEMASAAVRQVLEAFQKQDDEEQSVRLGRKNIQVMDRLAKMQQHQVLSIQTLQNCSNVSDKALEAANRFHSKCGIREVPLLKWTVVVGRSTGTCTITANHVLFITKLIPVLGGNKTTLFNVKDVEFRLEEEAVSLLNPLPTILQVSQNGRIAYSFRPSVGAARLKGFLDVLQATTDETFLEYPE